MTDKPELQHDSAQAGFNNAVVLGFIAYIIFPVLAVITAIFGAILLGRGSAGAGLAFFAVMQVWVAGGVMTHIKRRRMMLSAVQTMMEPPSSAPGKDTQESDHSEPRA